MHRDLDTCVCLHACKCFCDVDKFCHLVFIPNHLNMLCKIVFSLHFSVDSRICLPEIILALVFQNSRKFMLKVDHFLFFSFLCGHMIPLIQVSLIVCKVNKQSKSIGKIKQDGTINGINGTINNWSGFNWV